MWDPFWTFGPPMMGFGNDQASNAASRADAAQQRVKELEHRLERLALACSAMWSLLQTHTGLTDEQLQEKIKQIDAADGVVDGRLGRAMLHCPGCGRSVSPRRGKCIYCGAACGGQSAFEKS